MRVAAVSPSAEVEKALRAPTRERIQQQADEATFARRALAVEKERAIAENELQNRIELAGREEHLVDAGAREPADGAPRRRLQQTDADRGGDTWRAERRARARSRPRVPPAVLLALALQELAGQLGQIEHLTITPDLVTPVLTKLAAERGRREG